MVTYTCDRCGEKIYRENPSSLKRVTYFRPIGINGIFKRVRTLLGDTHDEEFYQEFMLCDDCAEEFAQWIGIKGESNA